MALRRVLVLIQVFSLRSNRQAHAHKPKGRQKAKMLAEHNTFSLIAIICNG